MTGLIEQYILAHSAAVGTAVLTLSGFGLTAFASTIPEQRPKTLDDWWAWGRDFIHQVGNAKRPTKP